jgi:arginine decarboxylase-like protein
VQESYFVIALTGAYQDVIEMDHNLLGDLPDVKILLTDDDKWRITWTTGAEPIEKILEHVGYSGMHDHEDPYMSDRKH